MPTNTEKSFLNYLGPIVMDCIDLIQPEPIKTDVTLPEDISTTVPKTGSLINTPPTLTKIIDVTGTNAILLEYPEEYWDSKRIMSYAKNIKELFPNHTILVQPEGLKLTFIKTEEEDDKEVRW